jgi:hypothetical protein
VKVPQDAFVGFIGHNRLAVRTRLPRSATRDVARRRRFEVDDDSVIELAQTAFVALANSLDLAIPESLIRKCDLIPMARAVKYSDERIFRKEGKGPSKIK